MYGSRMEGFSQAKTYTTFAQVMAQVAAMAASSFLICKPATCLLTPGVSD